MFPLRLAPDSAAHTHPDVMAIANPSLAMDPVVEIRPKRNVNGFDLNCGTLKVWFAEEIHAINYAQDLLGHFDIVVYNADGRVKQRYAHAER
jgi:hypothetical protein